MIAALAFEPPPYLALATKDAVVLLDEAGTEARRLSIVARRLEWAPDGRTLAILAGDGRLLTVRPGAEPEIVAEEAGEPVWTPDGRLLHTRGAKGVFAGATLLVPTAHSPAPGPDGDRLAFATDGAQGGIWTAGKDGEGARRLLMGERVGGVSWSYDGRWIGAVVDGHLRIVRSNGAAARDAGPVGGTTALWSGGAAELLARRGKSWSVYDPIASRWTEVEFDAVPEPRWIGPKRLLGVRGGSALEVALDGTAIPVGTIRPVLDVARVVGLYRGVGFPDRFRNAPRPSAGSSAWKGRIVSTDPIVGRVEFAVESEIDARGRETVLARSETRRATAPPGALTRRLAVLSETEAWLIVRGTGIVDAFLPDFPTRREAPEEIAPTARPARATRPPRAVEYDGVTRERVVVPMVYPMPGKHRFVDTFLAARDGGARRHHGNDLMAPKMTPLLAVFDGVVSFGRTDAPGTHNMLALRGDDGYVASYLHINNDTPGTDDGRGSRRFAFPADLQSGDRVRAGQIVAWCGDSGNAEDTGPHLHFELYDEDGRAGLDPYFSLKAARIMDRPSYSDPDPGFRASSGEVRWDGVVSSMDAVKGVVAVELTAVGGPGGAPRRNLMPRIVYLVVPEGQRLGYRGEGDLSYPLASVRPGHRISAVGTTPKGAKMTVRRASIALR